MAGYATKVKREIARWTDAGLIDAATAGRLSSDMDANGGARVSFGSVLAMMAGALFAAAILIFIASNWELIPRLVRVGLLFFIIIGGYVGGAILTLRGQRPYGEAAWLVAAAAFGGGIALIGQMYHLSGDERQAIFIWGAGTALAAAALRSGPLTIGAVLLGSVWMTLIAMDGWRGSAPPLSYLLVALVLWALSFWTRSIPARHLILLSIYLFVMFFYGNDETLHAPVLLATLSTGLFAIAHLEPVAARRIFGLGSGLPVQALLGFLVGTGIVQIDLIEERQFLVVSIVVFVAIVAALLLAGRENRMLRWLAYTAFIFQIGFIYQVMLGSMLGTSGFFVLGGLVLSLLAWLIARLERRLADPAMGEGAAT